MLSFILEEADLFDEDDQYLLLQSIIKELMFYSIDQTEYTLLKLITIFSNRMLNYLITRNLDM